MTMDDGLLPEVPELRGVLGRAKIVYGEYERALTRVCAYSGSNAAVRWELMAAVTDANVALLQNLRDQAAAMGLPYDHIIDSTCEVM